MGIIAVMLSYVLFLASLPLISALKFDVAAHHGHESAKYERCIRNFVAKDQLVVVTANVDGQRNDGQQLNMHVCLASLEQVVNTVLTKRTDQRCGWKRVWQAKGRCWT